MQFEELASALIVVKPAGGTVLQRSLAFYDAVGKVLAQENRP